jgi:TP901 family phage tail tape measure protein
MAKQTGISSNEAADALFFITSAGLRGKEAMDVLNASLKAAAIGLGETKTVADLATSAMNAYGSDVLSATNATDVMVAAVREGKLEASELAGSMGRVLPIASAMGVQFHEVGAAFAALSRTGTNAAEAATQIRGILASILKPSTQAEEMLNKLSLSSTGLRKSLREDGLLATLEILKEKFEGNDMAAQTVFGNVRALSGVMDLLGSNVDTTRQIFDQMTDSVGTAGKAYDIFAESKSAKMKKALNSAKEAFSELGMVLLDAVLPFIEKVSSFVTKAYDAFKNLDKSVQNTVLALGGIALVLPTVLSLLGSLFSALGLLLTPVGLIVAGLAAVGYIVVTEWESVRKGIVDVTNYFIDLYNESLAFRAMVELISATFQTMWKNGKLFVGNLVNLFKAATGDIGRKFQGLGAVIDGVLKGDLKSLQLGLATLALPSKGVEAALAQSGEMVVTMAENIYDGYVEGWERAQKADPINFITEKQVQDGVDKALNAAKEMWTSFSSMFGGNEKAKGLDVTAKGGVGLGFDEEKLAQNIVGLEQLASTLDNNDKKTKTLQETFTNWGLSVDAVMQDVSLSILDAFNQIAEGENVFKALGNAIWGIIKRLAAAAAAALLLSAILPSLGVSKIGNATTNFKGMFGALSGFGTAFANGGIVSSPTLGLVGEYAGARSNPEVIAPLDKLKSMIGDRGAGNVNVTGEFRLQGQDLVVALQRANKQRNRLG